MQRSQLSSLAPKVYSGTDKQGYQYQLIQVPYRAQLYDEWCWAAALQMIVLAVRGIDVPQHTFANIEYQCSGCDGSNKKAVCRQGCDVKSISLVLFNWGIKAKRGDYPVEFEVLEQQIKAGRPVIYNITFFDDTEHLGVLAGTRTKNEEQEVYVLDPDQSFFDALKVPHEGWIPYAALLNGYGLKGNWADTWLDIS